MSKDVKQVGQTYKEFLAEVRAKQFGWNEPPVTEIIDGSTVEVVETTEKETKGKKNK